MEKNIKFCIFLIIGLIFYSCSKDKKDDDEINILKASGNITSSNYWIHKFAEELTDLNEKGHLIRLKNGNIFTVGGTTARISEDNGKTWNTYPVSISDNYSIASAVFVETGKGTIVMGFINYNEKIWDWDNNIHDSPNAALPTYSARSLDGGKTWQDIRKLHNDWTGNIRSIVETNKGNIILASMMMKHNPGHHTVVTYTSKDDGLTWIQSNILDMGGSGDHSGLMEPSIIQLANGSIWMLVRTNWGYFYESYSYDEGISWSVPQKTNITASSSPCTLSRLQSGRLILIWNQFYFDGTNSYPIIRGDNNFTDVPTSWQREELSMMTSNDDGLQWTKPVVIARQFLYPPRQSIYEPSNMALWISYPHIFEAQSGEIWLTTEQGNLQMKFDDLQMK